MLRLATFLMILITLTNAQEYDYEYEEQPPESVLGYLMKEAVNQFITNPVDGDEIEKEESIENNQIEEDSSSIFTALKEKIFEINASSENEDPVYNFIMWFSAIALFFQAFYTPFGYTAINNGKRRRKKRGLKYPG